MLLLVAVVSALLLWYLLKRAAYRVIHRLPPGPWTIPLTKNTPFMTECAYKAYFNMQKKYGDIFGFYNGCLYTVVLSDFASIKEAFNKDEFTDRPESIFKISDDFTHVAEMNGADWKEMRRFTLTTLRSLGMGKNKIEEKIQGTFIQNAQEEISQDFERLESSSSKKEVNTHDFFARPLTNIIFSIVCGNSMGDAGPSLLQMFERYEHDLFTDKLLNTVLILHYPVVKYLNAILSAFKIKTKKKGITEMEEFMSKEISAHVKNYDPNFQEDFFDYYISEMKKNDGKHSSFTHPNMTGNGLGLLFAGSHTTRISLDWTFLCLAKFPEAQERAFREIKELLGTEKMPSCSDKDNLPYTNALIMEVARYQTVAPAQDPHWSGKSGTISGYHIPEGSMIIANVYAVHNDKRLWGDPENFRPERFLSLDGKKAVQPDYWIPFLTGKRVCPGEKLATMQLFLMTSAYIQRFKVLPPESGLSLQDREGILHYPLKPVVTFETRT